MHLQEDIRPFGVTLSDRADDHEHRPLRRKSPRPTGHWVRFVPFGVEGPDREHARSSDRRVDPTAAKDDVSVVAHRGLTRSDR